MNKQLTLLIALIFMASCKGHDKRAQGPSGAKDKKPEPQSLAVSPADTAFQHSRIRCIIQDKSGNIWFASNGDGVCRYNPATSGIDYFTEKEGLCSNYVWAIVEDDIGKLWCCTDYGICRYNGKSFTPFTAQSGSCDLRFTTALKDKNGTLWFSTDGGACCYDLAKGGFTQVSIVPKEKLSTPLGIYCLLDDQAGNIWFGTQNSVCRYDPATGKFAHFKEKGLDRVVRCIFQDKSGDLWFASNGGGVCRYDGKSFTNFSEEKGLSHNLFVSKLDDETQLLNRVWSIVEDQAGNIWFGTIDEGVWRYDGESMTNFTVRDGLSSNLISTIFVDKAGKLWFGTDGGGVCKFDGKYFVQVSGNGAGQ